MGCILGLLCPCFQPKTPESVRSKTIEQELRTQQKQEESIINLLMLGAGECGKSTVVKQMRIIYSTGFDDSEKLTFTPIIRDNVIRSIAMILQSMIYLGIKFDDCSLESLAEEIRDFQKDFDVTKNSEIPNKIVDAVEKLWTDPGLQSCFSRSNEYNLIDSAKYFLEKIRVIASSSYLPTVDDVIRSRDQTTAVKEIVIDVQTRQHRGTFRIIDVGGQRTQRRKWIHAFDNVTAVIWVAALSDYDLTLQEDPKRLTNRMQESLVLFESTIHMPIFRCKNIVLFLNKTDIFKEKIMFSPISKHFPACTSGDNYEQGREFFSNQFLSKNQSEKRRIYRHYTCATDTNALANLTNSVVNTIIEDVLVKTGLA